MPNSILASMFLLILFGVFRALISFAKSYFSILAMHSSIRHYRAEFVNKGLDSKYFNTTSEYQILFSEKTNQAGIFIQYLSTGVVSLLAVTLFFIFGLLYAPKEMIFSLGVTLLLMIPVKRVAFKIQSVGESLISDWNNINSKVLMTKKNLFFLMVYELIGFEKEELTKDLLRYERSYRDYAFASSFLASLPLLVGIVILSLCSYLSIVYFSTPGIKVLSFFYLFLRMTQGLSELNSTYAVLKLSYPSFRDVHKGILGMNNYHNTYNSFKLKEMNDKLPLFGRTLKVSFENVSFGYSQDVNLFNNFSFELNTGDVFIIKGTSGAGKSTLLKLLLGIERPNNGNIKINDQFIQDLDPCWKKNLGYVGSEPYMIPGTLRENLHFGNAGFGLQDSDCFEALNVAGLNQDFFDKDLSLDSYLAESAFFSTGQKQRIALARAFLRNPRIIIFDEATANLDIDTEQQIIKNIKNVTQERITIIVTHKNAFDQIGTKFLNIGS
jgi:ABC-type multidrug transport system fused ATPase/permease subunit